VASALSLYVHYQLYNDPSYTSFCDVTETVSCEAVLQSQYATMFGVPVAAGGAIWSALVLLLAWRGMGGPSGRGRSGCRLHLHSRHDRTLRGVVPRLRVLLCLQKACPLCLTMYASVIGIFIGVRAPPHPWRSPPLPGRIGKDISRMLRSPLGRHAGGRSGSFLGSDR
jgi:hypothetical protein